MMKGMEELDIDNLINWDTKNTQGHGKKDSEGFLKESKQEK